MRYVSWLQATREAVQVMLAAVAATGEAAQKVDATLAELQQLQVRPRPVTVTACCPGPLSCLRCCIASQSQCRIHHYNTDDDKHQQGPAKV